MIEFDAYKEWLQIPGDRRPPNYYELLGIAPFEADCERVYAAAKDRMAVLRRYQLGENAALSMRLQREVSQALDCLKSPTAKQEYDEALLARTESPSAAEHVDSLPPIPEGAKVLGPRTISPANASRTAARQKRTKESPAEWLKGPIGISVGVAACLMLLAGIIVGMSGGKTTEKGTREPSPGKPSETPVAKLSDLLGEWEKLATEFEADLPFAPDELLRRRGYNSKSSLQQLVDQAEATRLDRANNPQLESLRKLAAQIESERLQSSKIVQNEKDVDSVKQRLAKIEGRLATPFAQDLQIKSELESLDELERLVQSWQPGSMSQPARTRANQYLAEQAGGPPQSLAFLGACALLRDGSLDAAARQAIIGAWENAYSDQQRAAICQAMILSGKGQLVEDGIGRLKKEPRLLETYELAELLAAIERERAVWQPAREALRARFHGADEERLARILGPSATQTAKVADPMPPAPMPPAPMPVASRPSDSSQAAPPPPALRLLRSSATSQWNLPLALAGGTSLAPEQTRLASQELQRIERAMEHPFEYKNDKLPGTPLVRCCWTIDKKDGLSLDGWAVIRHENGTPKLVVEFDNDDRKGPLRYWSADGKLRFYANYRADKFDGLACVFDEGVPAAVMNYRLGMLNTRFAVDYSKAEPAAIAVDGAAPGLSEQFAALQEEFGSVHKEIQQEETKLKKVLKDAYTRWQKDRRAEINKMRRQRDKVVERAKNREYNAGVARAISALAVGTGAY